MPCPSPIPPPQDRQLHPLDSSGRQTSCCTHQVRRWPSCSPSSRVRRMTYSAASLAGEGHSKGRSGVRVERRHSVVLHAAKTGTGVASHWPGNFGSLQLQVKLSFTQSHPTCPAAQTPPAWPLRLEGIPGRAAPAPRCAPPGVPSHWHGRRSRSARRGAARSSRPAVRSRGDSYRTWGGACSRQAHAMAHRYSEHRYTVSGAVEAIL